MLMYGWRFGVPWLLSTIEAPYDHAQYGAKYHSSTSSKDCSELSKSKVAGASWGHW